MSEQITLFKIPKRERTDKAKRNWENAFQKWSDEQQMDGSEPYGCCGYGSMCDWCEDNSYGRPSEDAISREWILKEMHKYAESDTTSTEKAIGADHCQEIAKSAPSVIPQPEEGEWIDKGYYAECSICGGKSGTQFDGVQPIPLKTKYCPDCGSRMKGKER